MEVIFVKKDNNSLTIYRPIFLVLAAFITVFVIHGIVTVIKNFSYYKGLDVLILAIFFVALIALDVYVIRKAFKPKETKTLSEFEKEELRYKAIQQQIKHENKERKDFKKAEKRIKKAVQKEKEQRTIRGAHIAGLPLRENVLCTVYLNDDNIEITSSGNIFKINLDRVTDLTLKTESEISVQSVSSAGGAIAGAVLFGPVGALIGGRVKQKKDVQTRECFIITYIKQNNDIDYIGFYVTGNRFATQRLIRIFNEGREKTTNVVEL